jgi:hypothetical protein
MALFEDLAVYPRIVVTGPQRSGTRIAARMIAEDTGYLFVDERAFGFSDEQSWREILKAKQIVVHAPGMLKDVVDNPPSEVFIVLMRRDLAKIHESERRVGWDRDRTGGPAKQLSKFGLTSGDPAQVKYDYWESHEKTVPFLELEYESLREHPLFIPDDQRRDFTISQTRLSPDPKLNPDYSHRQAQPKASDLGLRDLAADLEGFERFRAAHGAMGEWGRGTSVVRPARLKLTREQAGQLIAEQEELISRYERDADDAPAETRTVLAGFFAYPEPPRVGADGPGEPAGPGS